MLHQYQHISSSENVLNTRVALSNWLVILSKHCKSHRFFPHGRRASKQLNRVVLCSSSSHAVLCNDPSSVLLESCWTSVDAWPSLAENRPTDRAAAIRSCFFCHSKPGNSGWTELRSHSTVAYKTQLYWLRLWDYLWRFIFRKLPLAN